MTYSEGHILLRAGGHFGTSGSQIDNWSTGMRFGNGQNEYGVEPSALQTFVDAAWTAFAAWHSSAGANVGSNCFLDWTTGAVIGNDGRYLGPGQPTTRHDGTPTPGQGTGQMPWSTANVMSLRTGNLRGLASNGRCYYPRLTVGLLPATGRLSDLDSQLAVNAFITLVRALNTAANIAVSGTKLRVFSQGGLSGAPRSAVVTSIRCDGRLDAIERRENNQPSTWMVGQV